jgi:putative endopeptidase
MRRLALGVTLAVLTATLGARQSPPFRSGLDAASFDRSVRPQDDLYRYVNGKWLTTTTIPPDRVTYGTFAELAERTEADIHRLIQGLNGRAPEERQIRDFYRSITDEARVEALGVTPIGKELERIDAIDSVRALARQTGRISALGAGGPFTTSAGLDGRTPASSVVTVSQGGTLLPERRYYLASDPDLQRIREQYVAYLERIFTLAARAEPAADARLVMALETRLAEAQRPASDPRTRPSRAFTLQALASEMPGFDWREWAKPQGMDVASAVILEEPEFFRGFARAAQEQPLGAWRAWLAARYITSTAIYLSRPFVDARFDFFGRILTGQEAPRERWKWGVSLINGYLGDAIGQLYVREHFPERSRDRVRGIVRVVLEAYRDAIDESSWMTADARRQARAKLDNLQARVGYPDRWRRYDGLRMEADDFLGNAQRAQQFENAYQMSRLQGRFEPRQWLMTPQTVNAYYTPSRNEIILPAAMLQPPLFDPEAEDAVNYGGIGAMIAHEITHAFDQRGRRFDAYGRPADWWTAADEHGFQTRANALVRQYDAFSPMPGHQVNGTLTLGENVADVTGLAIALRAYRRSLGGNPSPVLDGFTGEQRLLLRWAQIWREQSRPEYLKQSLAVSPHAPPRYRAHGALVNLTGFHDAFDVRPGDGLYRQPGERLRIW